jgi:predicted dithiol-disulfide oxidoreductase (DUF899 family)
MHTHHFPAETPAYREARDALLKAELDLRRQVERVAGQRRRLPLGAPVPEDYVFDEAARDLGSSPPRAVRMSALFAPEREALVVYNFMFGPKMEHPCPMCSSFIDGLAGNAAHLQKRVNLAIVAKSPIERVRDFARSRGWQALRILSSAKNNFNRDYFGEDENGDQNPLIHVFVKREGRVHHFYTSELQFLPSDSGQNQRHLDVMWPLWNVLDLVPEGRGDWFPSLSRD